MLPFKTPFSKRGKDLLSPNIFLIAIFTNIKEQTPEETGFPVCTIKNFPNSIEHTIHWARNDFEELFEKAGFTNGWKRFQYTKDLTANLVHPEVDVIHYYGKGVDTGLKFNYKDGDFANDPEVINGDGDGTVPI